MNDYASYLAQVNIGLLLFGLAYIVFLQKEQAFLLKRFLILLLLMAAALLPLLSFETALPLATKATQLNGNYLPAFLLSAEKAEVATASDSEAMLTVCVWLYWLVTSAFFILFLSRLAALLRRSFIAPVTGKMGLVKIHEADSIEYAFSFFNHIFIGHLSDLDDSARNKIVNHELVHCKEWHSLDILLIELLQIFCWFNPAVYLFKQRLIETHEYRADQLSVEKGNKQAYCSLIATLALSSAGYSIANHFNKSLTLKRIAMIKSNKTKTSWWKLAAIAPFTLVFFIVVSCDQQPAAEAADEIEIANEASKEDIFTIVENLPAFPGGMESLYKFFSENLTYPEEAKKAGVEGKVLVEFVVDKDGTITNAKVIEGIGNGCDEEALRVINASPTWTPAMQRGKRVRTRLILPLYFSLGSSAAAEIPSVPTLVGDPLEVEIKKTKNKDGQTVISGVVKTDDGEGIPGANIIFAGTTNGTVSDLDGTFKLVTEAESGDLIVSFVGFKTRKTAF
ncbi:MULTISPECIES: M56 family metallopeptidase [unclassified Imperialibacter]|uniref:M56 family metallopeptidase n=1 Tax=unclassified Imperialibacter TaxID=2629706 RepID=UPI001259A0ED|nr:MULTISPECIES: M56 family metallopeptidase [unclassified Imperialibacter]CAD5283534.1 putative TonB family C-terminal domain-containing protein [Imperialibacter sp. 89]CAD5286004.1 putative TonB family C-terminal domain-containing protein [Imperialibacter sp. 75]VVT29670.1 putative TonB family C-terminal domain-containing protein [Imperialibacter sp. EC-SDR9]